MDGCKKPFCGVIGMWSIIFSLEWNLKLNHHIPSYVEKHRRGKCNDIKILNLIPTELPKNSLLWMSQLIESHSIAPNCVGMGGRGINDSRQ